ncbi:hypothetical protein DKX38_015651 [Salix brachista]|uniref:GDSL esterase/lipase n=1 Tax=Salix brachista TaxID=2182728 RepID=A0A5N5L6G9_9ROSI|nr:hypothetical protein DKX38_015651 [Salix brachista]
MVVRSGDIFNCFLHHGTPTTDPGAYVQGMLAQAGNLIGRIYKLGARRIALFSLGPAGCIPARALLPGAPADKCFGECVFSGDYSHPSEHTCKLISEALWGGKKSRIRLVNLMTLASTSSLNTSAYTSLELVVCLDLSVYYL